MLTKNIKTQVIEQTSELPTAITRFEFSPEMGAATLCLEARAQGKRIQVFAPHDLTEFAGEWARDPNASFKKFNVPLFPMANRLLVTRESNLAEVEGILVKMPVNNAGQLPGAIPHHLHGLTYAAQANELVGSEAIFSDFFKGYWTGQAELRIHQSIQNGEFHYEMTAKNIGKTPLPVGFGSHPYFEIPSHEPSQIKLKIPSEQIAELDNLDNVLPTGKVNLVSENGGRLDFTSGKNLPAGVIDNYFFLNPKAANPVIELIDPKANLKYLLTALTRNIVGAQVYYPGTGNVIAIELVTHVPDPRKGLWKDTPTGMQVLKSGESARYAYKISVESLSV